MANHELGNFLREQCKEKNLSLRSLSLKSGLSAGTVHNIIKRKYQPTLFSLNRLADYLSVSREYLWQLAGLIEDNDCENETGSGDPRLDFQFAQIRNLPTPARNLVISIIEAMLVYLKSWY